MAKRLGTWNYIRQFGGYFHWLQVHWTRTGFVAVATDRGLRYVRLPRHVWSTKSHEWWALLGALLARLQPDSILELGSGRSTVYLSEYACKKGKALVSVDEDPSWVAANRLIARFGSLGGDFIHHVALGEDHYYDVEEVKRLLVEPPDFIYLDGPISDRSGLTKHRFYLDLCANADVIVIDDIQWGHIYDQMEALQDAGKKRRRTVVEYEIKGGARQFLCALVRDDLQPAVDEIIRCLRIDTVEGYSRAECVRE